MSRLTFCTKKPSKTIPLSFFPHYLHLSYTCLYYLPPSKFSLRSSKKWAFFNFKKDLVVTSSLELVLTYSVVLGLTELQFSFSIAREILVHDHKFYFKKRSVSFWFNFFVEKLHEDSNPFPSTPSSCQHFFKKCIEEAICLLSSNILSSYS